MSYVSDTEFDPERSFGGDCTCKGIDYESDCPVCGPLLAESKAYRPMCDILPQEDRDMRPVHGTEPQEKQAPPRISVGRTRPLWEEPSESTAINEIWQTVERMYFDGRITWRQRGLFGWAVRKAREVESRRGQCGAGVQEL